MNFTELIDLASARVGGRAQLANDEFFGRKESLLRPEAPVCDPNKYTSRGKWVDGWETRRRRAPGFDWCVVKLGLRGVIRGVVIDTSHFTGDYPEHCSIDACDARPDAPARRLVKDPSGWSEILPKSALRGGAANEFPIRSLKPWTHLRLNVFPDGGVARLRVHGDVMPDWEELRARKSMDLAAAENGGLVLASSDMHFGSRDNLIMPGRARDMGDAWETRRRRGPGHDWCVIKLGASGAIERVEVDTSRFKGSHPDSCSLEACDAPAAALGVLLEEAANWVTVLPKTKLKPDSRQGFEVRNVSDFSHVRFNIYPDGGVARLRLYGRPKKS